MEQFVPLFIERFGPAWLETGGFSVYFKNATLSGQPVRAILSAGASEADAAKLTMHDADDRIICEGDAWLGKRPEKTVLRSRLQRFIDGEAGPLLNNLSKGREVKKVPSQIALTRLEKDRVNVTEHIQAYTAGVLPPNLAIDSLRAVEPVLITLPEESIGLYGGIELQMLDGPICADIEYTANGKIIALGQTPRTEVLFYESELYEANALIAKMIMMSRIMAI